MSSQAAKSGGAQRWVEVAGSWISRVFVWPGLSWLALVICLLATAAATAAAWQQKHTRDAVEFLTRTRNLQEAVLNRLETYVRMLEGARGLLVARTNVTAGDWKTFVSSLELGANLPGLIGLGYVGSVGASSNGLPHYVVQFVEPLEPNRSALGFDLASDPARRWAADQARDTGRGTLTEKLRLVQAPQVPGVLLLLPVYAQGSGGNDVPERRARLRGWVYAALVVEDMLAGLDPGGREGVDLEVFDGPSPVEAARLTGEIHAAAPGFARTTTLEVWNRQWTLRFRARPGFSQFSRLSAPGYLAAGAMGLFISLLVFGIARSLATTRLRAAVLAKSMTSQLRLQERAMRSATDGIFILDSRREESPIIYANPAFEKLTGYSAQDRLGTETRLMLRREPTRKDLDLPGVRAALRSGAGSHRTIVREYRKDGSVFWAEFSLAPVHDDEGVVTHYVGVAEDISARRQAELAVQESQERLALVIEGSSDGIWDWNVSTNEVYFSPRWKSMLGYAEDELANQFSSWEELLHPEDRHHAQQMVQAYFKNEIPVYELEHRLRHKDGTYRWILARGVALRDAAGRPLRMAGSHVDLTQRKEAEAELKVTCVQLAQSQAALQETVRQLKASHEELQRTQLQFIQAAKLESVGTLAAGVAHEVKNPLQTILMGLDFLTRHLTASDSKTQLALSDMRHSVKRADAIVRELLHFSASAPFDLEEQDLNGVVRRSVGLVHPEHSAAATRVILELQEDLPRVRIDKAKFEQAMVNLLLNARQAMADTGTLAVRTFARTFGDDLLPGRPAHAVLQTGVPVVVVEVQDSGPGIPEAHLGKVFDPFFTTKPVGTGSGLGLSVVQKIMDLHCGAVHLCNVRPNGVRATLVLKADAPATAGAEPPPPTTP